MLLWIGWYWNSCRREIWEKKKSVKLKIRSQCLVHIAFFSICTFNFENKKTTLKWEREREIIIELERLGRVLREQENLITQILGPSRETKKKFTNENLPWPSLSKFIGSKSKKKKLSSIIFFSFWALNSIQNQLKQSRIELFRSLYTIDRFLSIENFFLKIWNSNFQLPSKI